MDEDIKQLLNSIEDYEKANENLNELEDQKNRIVKANRELFIGYYNSVTVDGDNIPESFFNLKLNEKFRDEIKQEREYLDSIKEEKVAKDKIHHKLILQEIQIRRETAKIELEASKNTLKAAKMGKDKGE